MENTLIKMEEIKRRLHYVKQEFQKLGPMKTIEYPDMGKLVPNLHNHLNLAIGIVDEIREHLAERLMAEIIIEK